MSFLRLLFSHSFVLLQLAFSTISQPDFIHFWCYNDRGNYTANSNYKRNLNSLLSSLDSNTEIDYGFYNLSVGQAPDQVNAIALCRGDIGVDDCRGCIRNSTRKILEICPYQKDAMGVYDFCRLRYSNRSIIGAVASFPIFYITYPNNAADVKQFTQAQYTLLNRLEMLTTSGNSIRKFATGNESAGFERVYGLMQCTPDLSGHACGICLAELTGEVANTCAGKLECSVIKPSCDVRLNNTLFYQLTPPNTPSLPLPPSPPTQGKKSNEAQTIVVIIVPTVCLVIFLVCVCIFLSVQRPRENAEKAVNETETAESLHLDFDIVRDATNNFSDQNKLGQGGFGTVYKGIYPNKQEIAVKRLSNNSGQGDLEFKNEVLLLAKLQHRNLIRLLGCCMEGNERLLIYEFLPNTSLDHFICDPIRRQYLDWDKRYKIICGIARGLHYLHEDSRLRIIHRDLKASNVLLDEDMNPKISDFGMARLFPMDQTQANTKRIVGTYGYMPPEYAMRGKFSVKSDVFSYGVLLLEIVSGQKNSCSRNGEEIGNLLSYAWKNWREGTYMNVVDPVLTNGSRTEIIRCIHIGLLCVQENVADRPTMPSVVLMLNSYSLSLPKPSKPAFLIYSNIGSDMSSSSVYNSRAETLPLSKNETSITQLSPR